MSRCGNYKNRLYLAISGKARVILANRIPNITGQWSWFVLFSSPIHTHDPPSDELRITKNVQLFRNADPSRHLPLTRIHPLIFSATGSMHAYGLPWTISLTTLVLTFTFCSIALCLQCFDAVGWAAGRASGLWKTEQWGADMVICQEPDADLHMTHLMPVPLTVSCFSKIQIGFTFLVPADLGSPGKRAVKRACVC